MQSFAGREASLLCRPAPSLFPGRRQHDRRMFADLEQLLAMKEPLRKYHLAVPPKGGDPPGSWGESSAEQRARLGPMPDPANPPPERVTFTDEEGHTLVGILMLPELTDVAILCHGYTSSKDGFHLKAIADRLAKDGAASLRFDFSGNGESSGDFKFANYSAEVDQIVAAVRYLESRGKRVFGLLGHSKGGTEVILYGSRHDDGSIRIVNICGRLHLKAGISARFDDATLAQLKKEGSLQLPHPRSGKPFTLTQQDMDERLNTDMVAAAKKIQNTMVMTIHGTADDTIPVADAEEFDEHIKQHTLAIVEGADHGFSEPSKKKIVVELAATFLLDGLPETHRYKEPFIDDEEWDRIDIKDDSEEGD